MEWDQSTVLTEILKTLKEIKGASQSTTEENEPHSSRTIKQNLPEELPDDLTVAVRDGASCRRGECPCIYTGWNRANKETCFYHPGFLVRVILQLSFLPMAIRG